MGLITDYLFGVAAIGGLTLIFVTMIGGIGIILEDKDGVICARDFLIGGLIFAIFYPIVYTAIPFYMIYKLRNYNEWD